MADFPTAWFYIKSVCSKKVIQPLGGSFEPTRLVVVDQKFGQESAAQLWKHENGYLVNKLTNLCLDYEHGNYKRLGYAAPVEHVNPWATLEPSTDDEPGEAQTTYY
ncbi:hypothetical protein PGT21_020587 [Puccinia graminis f. sp. tritici]|uniref:Uncharacterized protein n=1 Tax=Puccinia graminis f. sp. tritici TaxID=56615 RepID=A0A5B0PPB4_PUCGR|nr:hypothetical protein PGT21_020587 [Puccinia graminis f. sp. tritici]KAA1112326.1 hypothetical protein PGTUg99_016105 [Puccinia graminis f. sp. tritici]